MNATNTAEKVELETLGFLFAQMPWLTCHTESPTIKGGARKAGVTFDDPNNSVDTYNGIIYYRRTRLHRREGVHSIELRDFKLLTRFVGEAVKELYRRGIMR